jgi:hypothetical protein
MLNPVRSVVTHSGMSCKFPAKLKCVLCNRSADIIDVFRLDFLAQNTQLVKNFLVTT